MFPERLKKERTKCKLTQSELAKKLGLTQQAIGKWEQGVAEPDIATINKLAQIFDCNPNYLLGNTNNSSPIETNNVSSKLSTEDALLIAIRNMLGREPTNEELKKFLNISKVFFDIKE